LPALMHSFNQNSGRRLVASFQPAYRLFLLISLVTGRFCLSAPFLPVDSVKPGMKGFGLSVFTGTRIDTFQVEVLDVMKKISPRGDLILCRLSGAGLENSGVIAGMSGSPVYINDKLLGAVAYAWSWAKEPIAGVTPIQEMLDIWQAQSGSRPRSRAPRSNLPHLPIPIAISGLNPELEQLLTPTLAALGMKPVAGASNCGTTDTTGFVPGGVIGVALIDGDVRAAAVGTITYREGNRILAFGHPFFQGGDVQLPMTGGVIHSILPSFATSFKLFSPGPPIGTVTQDRAPGIAGTIGTVPPMLPVRVVVNSPKTRDTYNFRIAIHEQLTPEFMPIALAEAVLQTEGTLEEVTLNSRLLLRFTDGTTAQIRHTFAGINPVVALLENTRNELQFLFANDIKPVALETVEAIINITPGRTSAELIAAVPERTWVHPGETLAIYLEIRDYRGTETEQIVRIPIPATTPPGIINVTLTSAAEFLHQQIQRLPRLANPTSLTQLLKLLEDSGREDELIVAGFLTQPALALGEREMPNPPPSILQIFSSSKKGGRTQPVPNSLLFKIPVKLNRVIQGSVSFDLEVK